MTDATQVKEAQERTAFIEAYRDLDLTEVSDAWGRPAFRHSHVQAMWDGWLKRSLRAPSPAALDAISYDRAKARSFERVKPGSVVPAVLDPDERKNTLQQLQLARSEVPYGTAKNRIEKLIDGLTLHHAPQSAVLDPDTVEEK